MCIPVFTIVKSVVEYFFDGEAIVNDKENDNLTDVEKDELTSCKCFDDTDTTVASSVGKNDDTSITSEYQNEFKYEMKRQREIRKLVYETKKLEHKLQHDRIQQILFESKMIIARMDHIIEGSKRKKLPFSERKKLRDIEMQKIFVKDKCNNNKNKNKKLIIHK